MFRRKLEDVEPDDEWDPNKKHFIEELKRSNWEKMVYVICIIVLCIIWLALIQPKLVLDPEWNN